MADAGSSGFRVPFVGVNRDAFFRPFNITTGYHEFIGERICSKICIPYAALFSQKAKVKVMFEIFDNGNIRVIRMWGMNHIEGKQTVSLQDVSNMLNGLGVAGLFFVFAVVFPFFAQNDSTLILPLCILGSEDDKLLVMINK